RCPTRCSSSTWASTASPSPKRASSASPSSRSSTAIIRRSASITSSPATTTPARRSACMRAAPPMRFSRAAQRRCRRSPRAPPTRRSSSRSKARTNDATTNRGSEPMTAITASMVKELREKTDAPMMECKKALAEAGGDLARAEEILRVKLGNKASKAAARVAAEGIVAVWIADDAKLGALVEVNSETDFVARNDDFVAFARTLAERVATQAPADVDALAQLPIDGGTVEQVRTALVGRIGENITVRRFARIEAKGRLTSYVHGGSKIGVLVDVVGGDEALGRDLAMHIAASKPKSLSRDGVPAEDVERERSIAQQKAAEEQAKAQA